MDTVTYWALWWALRPIAGKAFSDLWHVVKYEVKRSSGVCALCGKKLKWKERTIDHIIPRNIIHDLGLIELELDKRNLRVTCWPCNIGRGVLTIEDMPDKVRDKLLIISKNNMSMPD